MEEWGLRIFKKENRGRQREGRLGFTKGKDKNLLGDRRL